MNPSMNKPHLTSNNAAWIEAHYPECWTRREQAYRLHEAGQSYRQIARVMGLSKSRARMLVKLYARWMEADHATE